MHFSPSPSSWQTFSTEFTTTGFTGTTTDTRLRFWFVGLASSGDIYWIIDVVLEEIEVPSSPAGIDLNLEEVWQGWLDFWRKIGP